MYKRIPSGDLRFKSILPRTNLFTCPEAANIASSFPFNTGIFFIQPQICSLKSVFLRNSKTLIAVFFTYLQSFLTTASIEILIKKERSWSPFFKRIGSPFVAAMETVDAHYQRIEMKRASFFGTSSIDRQPQSRFFSSFICKVVFMYEIFLSDPHIELTERHSGCVNHNRLLQRFLGPFITFLLRSMNILKTRKISPGVHGFNSTNLSRLLKQISPLL